MNKNLKIMKGKEFLSCPINGAIIRCSLIRTVSKQYEQSWATIWKIEFLLDDTLKEIWVYDSKKERDKTFERIKNQLIK